MSDIEGPPMRDNYVCIRPIGKFDVLPEICKGEIVSIGPQAFKGFLFDLTRKEKFIQWLPNRLTSRTCSMLTKLSVGDEVYYMRGDLYSQIKYKDNALCIMRDVYAQKYSSITTEAILIRLEYRGHLKLFKGANNEQAV